VAAGSGAGKLVWVSGVKLGISQLGAPNGNVEFSFLGGGKEIISLYQK